MRKAPARVEQAATGEGRRPRSEHADEATRSEMRLGLRMPDEAEACASERCLEDEVVVVERERALHVDRGDAPVSLELPVVDRAARRAFADAIVDEEIARLLRDLALREVGRRADHRHAQHGIATMSCGTASARRTPASYPSATMSTSRSSVPISIFTSG